MQVYEKKARTDGRADVPFPGRRSKPDHSHEVGVGLVTTTDKREALLDTQGKELFPRLRRESSSASPIRYSMGGTYFFSQTTLSGADYKRLHLFPASHLSLVRTFARRTCARLRTASSPRTG